VARERHARHRAGNASALNSTALKREHFSGMRRNGLELARRVATRMHLREGPHVKLGWHAQAFHLKSRAPRTQLNNDSSLHVPKLNSMASNTAVRKTASHSTRADDQLCFAASRSEALRNRMEQVTHRT